MSDVIIADKLRQYIERAERLISERKGIQDDIRDVMAEAKSQGYHVPTIRSIIKLRGMEAHHREEAEMLLDTYAAAVGLR